jgi:hypothetical protein
MVCSSAGGGGEHFKSQSMNSGNTLIPTDGGCGDLAGNSVSLTVGTPADTVHINSLIALRRNGCFQYSGSVDAAPQRTACHYQIFVVTRGEDGRNSLQNAQSLWRQLSRPKKSVRVGRVIQKWKKKA